MKYARFIDDPNINLPQNERMLCTFDVCKWYFQVLALIFRAG